MRKVKTKRPNVVTYTRPSMKAIPANQYERAGQELIVYPCINGWFELRGTNNDNLTTVEFIRRQDIRYTMAYMKKALKEKVQRIKRMKSLSIKLIKRSASLSNSLLKRLEK